MDDLKKLKHLLRHWKEHNDEHAETYRQWAEKASAIGKSELSKALGNLYYETKRLNTLFDDVLKATEEKN